VFAWEGTLGTGLFSTGLAAINSALKDYYKPIVDSYPDAVWHYNSQKKFNPVGFLDDIKEVKNIALTPEPDFPCCFPRIVFLGYSWGGLSAALAVKKLSEEPEPTKRIIIDAVFTIDPVVAPAGLPGQWWKSTAWAEDASKFNNFCEWESHFQTVDKKSLVSVVPALRSIKGDTITGASNVNENALYPAGGPFNPDIAHITLPQRAKVRNAFKDMLALFFTVKGIRRTECCGIAADCPVRPCL
jgi:hypothetical protein